MHYRLFGMEPGEQPLQPRKAAQQIARGIPAEGVPAAGGAGRGGSLPRHVRPRGRARRSVRGARQAGAEGGAGVARFSVPDGEPQDASPASIRSASTSWRRGCRTSCGRPCRTRRCSGWRSRGGCRIRKCWRRKWTACSTIRARAPSSSTFIGQWLGTQDIGGRVVPMLTEIQSYYTSGDCGRLERAADPAVRPHSGRESQPARTAERRLHVPDRSGW